MNKEQGRSLLVSSNFSNCQGNLSFKWFGGSGSEDKFSCLDPVLSIHRAMSCLPALNVHGQHQFPPQPQMKQMFWLSQRQMFLLKSPIVLRISHWIMLRKPFPSTVGNKAQGERWHFWVLKVVPQNNSLCLKCTHYWMKIEHGIIKQNLRMK